MAEQNSFRDVEKSRQDDERTESSLQMPLEGEASEPFDDGSTVRGTGSSQSSIKGKEDPQEEHAIVKPVELPSKRGSKVTRYIFRSSQPIPPQGARAYKSQTTFCPPTGKPLP